MNANLTRAVARLLPELELRMFQEWDDRERWAEIRRLAQEQVRDDVNDTTGERRDRIGRQWVGHGTWGEGEDRGGPLWRRLTPEQVELESNLVPLLRDTLTPKQADAIRLLFYGQLSEQQAALAMGISRATLREHRDAALRRLRAAIADKYLAPSPNVAD